MKKCKSEGTIIQVRGWPCCQGRFAGSSGELEVVIPATSLKEALGKGSCIPSNLPKVKLVPSGLATAVKTSHVSHLEVDLSKAELFGYYFFSQAFLTSMGLFLESLYHR